MIKRVNEEFNESMKKWVEIFKEKIGNINDCEREWIKNEKIRKVCEYIWKEKKLK